MRIVIDSNRVIAALIKDSTTRKILFDKNFDFVAPDYIKIEISKYKSAIIETIGIAENEFDILLSLAFESITTIPENEYHKFIVKFKNSVEDQKDVAYIAACSATKSEGIWTHDPHFKEQKKVKVFTNIDLLKLSKK